MSVARLALTGAAMAGIAAVLAVLAPAPGEAVRTVFRAQEVAALGGAETVVLALTGLLAWAAWAWGAVGLLLAAAGALPGLPGAVARGVARVLVPERLRTTAAIALGVGIAMAGPAAAAPASPGGPTDPPSQVAGPPGPPDWPTDDPAAQPAAEPATEPEAHVVVPGDCLWRIAADRLEDGGTSPTDAETAQAVAAWWAANTDVIGADPDLIHPGQVLQAPPSRPDPAGGAR
jgi:LysM repeat protein